MGYIKRTNDAIFDLQVKTMNHDNVLMSLKETNEKLTDMVLSLQARITELESTLKNINDSQNKIIEQNKKSQEERTIMLREYLASPADVNEV